MKMFRSIFHLAAAIGLLAIGVGACRPAGAGYRSADELRRALSDAGAEVLDSAIVASPALGVPGRVYIVNRGQVRVYEFPSEAARSEVSGTIAVDGSRLGDRQLQWPARPTIWASGRLIVAYAGTDGGLILLLNGLLGDPITRTPGGAEEPYPPAVTAALLGWAQARGIDPGTVEVVTYAAAEWPDSCLGYPRAGEACAEVVTSGWSVQLRAGTTEVEVHTDELGTQVRLPPSPDG